MLVYWVYSMSWFKDIQTHRWTRFVCMPDTPMDGQGLFVCPTHPCMDKLCLYARHTHRRTTFVCMPNTPMDGQGLSVCPTHPWMDKVYCMPDTPMYGQGLFVCPTHPWMDKVCLYAQHTHGWTRFVCMPQHDHGWTRFVYMPDTHPWMDKVCVYARHTHGWTRFVCMPVMIKNTKLKYNLLTSSQNTFIDNKYCDIHLFSRSQSRMEVIKKSAEYYLYSCQVIRCFHVYPIWY